MGVEDGEGEEHATEGTGVLAVKVAFVGGVRLMVVVECDDGVHTGRVGGVIVVARVVLLWSSVVLWVGKRGIMGLTESSEGRAAVAEGVGGPSKRASRTELL